MNVSSLSINSLLLWLKASAKRVVQYVIGLFFLALVVYAGYLAYKYIYLTSEVSIEDTPLTLRQDAIDQALNRDASRASQVPRDLTSPLDTPPGVDSDAVPSASDQPRPQ